MAVQAEVLVGRDAETELLAASLEAASQGQPRCVLVVGEVGIGKTRLLQEGAKLAEPLGLRVLMGTAVEGGVAMPYLPLLAPLADCVENANDASAALVRRLLAGEPPGRVDDAGAARLVESIFAVLVREPTLLVIDDVHWADASTAAVLDYLSHRARSESLAVVAAARDDEPERLARLPIADGRRFAPLRLGRLTEDEVAEQVAALLGRVPEADLVSVLFQRSAGNPFFVEQLLAQDLQDPSPSLRALVRRRLVELPDPARRVVHALSVVGRPTDEALVAAVAGLEEGEAETALREAVGRGVAVTLDEGFAFRHPLFLEVVADELAGSTRRALHRRAAQALDASGGELAERAMHWWEAGDAERAHAAALEAAEQAEGAFAFAEARLHLERSLEVWPQGLDGRVDCLLRAAAAAWFAGDPTGALAIAREALSEGASNGAALELAIGTYAWDAGEHSAAAAAFEHAADLVQDDTPPATRAQALWALARARIGQNRFADAREIAAQAAAIGHDAEDSVVEARSLFTVGVAQAYAGNLAGVADIERGVDLAVAAGSPVAIGHGYQFVTNLVHLSGDLERALELALAGIDACERVGLARSHASDLRGRAGLILLELGRWDEADEVLKPAEPRALAFLARALLAMRRGHFETAELNLEQAAGAPAIGGPGALHGDLDLARAELAWLDGDIAAARSALEGLEEVEGVWEAASYARRSWLAARLAADDPRRSAPVPPQRHHPDPHVDAALRAEIEAERARALGAPDPELWELCVSAWNTAGRPYDETYATVRQAEALFAVAAREPAKQVLRKASASASLLGARPLRELAEGLARRARVSPESPRRRQSARDEPTPRELDVLALLADGLTNREIAARLFLSPKTVDIHVSRLRRKLDAHTRGEAVAVARRRGLLA